MAVNQSYSTTDNQIPAYLENASKNLIGSVVTPDGTGGISNTLYESYKDASADPNNEYQQRIANMDDASIQAYQNMTAGDDPAFQGIGGYQDYMDQANESVAGTQDPYALSMGAANANVGASGGYDASALGAGGEYFNPYQENVIDTTMDTMRREGNIGMNDVQAGAAQSGSFGGSRHGIAEAEYRTGVNREMGNTTATLNDRGFQQARDQQEQHLQRQYQAGMGQAQNAQQTADLGLNTAKTQAGLGKLQQDQFMNEQNALDAFGSKQQKQAQMQSDFDFEEFTRMKADPYQKAAFTNSILQGAPSGGTTVTQTSEPGTSSLAQGIGALGAYATMGNQFGWWGNNDE